MNNFIPSELLYLPLDLPNPPKYFFNRLISDIDNNEFHSHTIKTILEPSINNGYFDAYRNSEIIHLCDREGNFLPVVKQYQDNTDMEDWFKEIWQYFQPTRAAVTITFPGDIVPYHIDCSPTMFHTVQHKIRYIIRCDQKLDFGLNNNKTASPPCPWIDTPFVFSGKWPHTLNNNSDKNVYIFTMGAPWEAKLHDTKYIELLNKSYQKYKDDYMSMRNLELPMNYFTYYEEKYKANY